MATVNVGEKSNYLKLHKGEKMIINGNTRTLFNSFMAKNFYLECHIKRLDTIGERAEEAKKRYGFSAYDTAVPQNWLNEIMRITGMLRKEFIWVYPADTCFPVTYPGYLCNQRYLMEKNHLSYYFSCKKYLIDVPILTEEEYNLTGDLINGRLSYDNFFEIAQDILFSLGETYGQE